MSTKRKTHRRLVVGGGRAPGFPRLPRGSIALNIDASADPDVVGDMARMPFLDACFDELFVERVPYSAFTGRRLGTVSELKRVLVPGGRLIIDTGALAPVSQLREALRVAGFRGLRVRLTGLLRITARLGERS